MTNTSSYKLGYDPIVVESDYPHINFRRCVILRTLENKTSVTVTVRLPSTVCSNRVQKMVFRYWTNILHNRKIPCLCKKAKAWHERIQKYLKQEFNKIEKRNPEPIIDEIDLMGPAAIISNVEGSTKDKRKSTLITPDLIIEDNLDPMKEMSTVSDVEDSKRDPKKVTIIVPNCTFD